MADRRRRRRRLSNSESELSEDEIPTTPKPTTQKTTDSECASCMAEPICAEAEDAESRTSSEPVIDSTTEVNPAKEDDDEDEEDDEDETEDDDDTETTCTEYDEDSVIIEDGWIETERQSGDGEEQPDKNLEADLDDDEDQKNPAYIPRKGAFYEHDTRDVQQQQVEEKLPKKKLWKDDGGMWDHDRYRPELQGPKSREELVAAYGYDIRESDRPPDAPRRSDKPRRGRGNRVLSDFMNTRMKDQFGRGGSRSRSDSRGSQWSKSSDQEGPRYDQDPKINYNDSKDFPVLNRKTMMYEYPDLNTAAKDVPLQIHNHMDSNHDKSQDSYQGNIHEGGYGSRGGRGYNNGPRGDAERGGFGRSPGRSGPGRGGRGGERGGGDYGGRGGSRGGRGDGGDGGARGRRGGYNSNSYSDLRSRNERNAELGGGYDYNTPKNDRYERNYERSNSRDNKDYGNNSRAFGNNSRGYGNSNRDYGNNMRDNNRDYGSGREFGNNREYGNNSGGPRRDTRGGRNDGYDNDRKFSRGGGHHDTPRGGHSAPSSDGESRGGYTPNAYNNRSPPTAEPQPHRPPPPQQQQQPESPKPVETIVITNTVRKTELLPDVPPEIVPKVTSAHPHATFQPPVTSTAGSTGPAGERKSYAREREQRRNKSGFPGTPPGKPSVGGPPQPPPAHQQGPAPRVTEPSKPVVYHHSSGMTAGTGRVGHGHSGGSGPVTMMTSSVPQKTHPDMSNRPAFQPPSTTNAPPSISKADQNRPKRYSSQRQRAAPDQPYPESTPPAEPTHAPTIVTPQPTRVTTTPQQGTAPRIVSPHVTTVVSHTSTNMSPGPRPAHPTAPNTSPNARALPFYPGAMYPSSVPTSVFRPTSASEQSTPRTVATFSHQPALVQQPVPYAIPPPSVPAVSPPVPRAMYTAPPTAMATPQAIMQQTYMATPIMTYPAPPPTGPPTGPYPIQGQIQGPIRGQIQGQIPGPIQGQIQGQISGPMQGHVAMQAFTSTPQVTHQHPQPLQPPVPVASPTQTDLVHLKGGTTYFNPVLQQPSPNKGGMTYFNPVLQQPSVGRSASRRPKAAIPIVNPQDLPVPIAEEGYDDQYYDDDGEIVGEESGPEDANFQPAGNSQPTNIISQLSSTAQEFIPRHLIPEQQPENSSTEPLAQLHAEEQPTGSATKTIGSETPHPDGQHPAGGDAKCRTSEQLQLTEEQERLGGSSDEGDEHLTADECCGNGDEALVVQNTVGAEFPPLRITVRRDEAVSDNSARGSDRLVEEVTIEQELVSDAAEQARNVESTSDANAVVAERQQVDAQATIGLVSENSIGESSEGTTQEELYTSVTEPQVELGEVEGSVETVNAEQIVENVAEPTELICEEIVPASHSADSQTLEPECTAVNTDDTDVSLGAAAVEVGRIAKATEPREATASLETVAEKLSEGPLTEPAEVELSRAQIIERSPEREATSVVIKVQKVLIPEMKITVMPLALATSTAATAVSAPTVTEDKIDSAAPLSPGKA